MTNYDFLLFTTCDAKGERIGDLRRLLSSIDQSTKEHLVSVKHYILLQRAHDIPAELMLSSSKDRVFITANSRLSLSRARNIMINQAMKDLAFSSADLCAFPDDDAWYPDGFLMTLKDYLISQPNLSVFTCDYGSNPVSKVNGVVDLNISKSKTTSGAYIRRVSSNTIFLKSNIALACAFFDERLGVGAEINGGEDLDYALRAFIKSDGQAVMSSLKLVGHRDRLQWVRSKYFAGSLFAIARSARFDRAIFLQMLRKVSVGFCLVLRRELALKDYLTGLKVGVGGLFSQNIQVSSFD